MTTGRTHSEQQHLWMCWGIHKLYFSFCSYRHFRPQLTTRFPQKLMQACRTRMSCLLEDQSIVCNQAQMVQTGTPQCGFTWNDELSCKEACCCKPLTCSLLHNSSNCWRNCCPQSLQTWWLSLPLFGLSQMRSLLDSLSMMGLFLSLRSLGGSQRLIMLVK
jgi:hypothetical protein